MGKDLLLSKSFWGLVLMLVALVMNSKGYNIDAEGWTNDIMAVLGSMLALVGRFKAEKKITSVAGIALPVKEEPPAS